MKAFFSKIWKWIVANKVISAVIGGVAVVGITLAIVLPLSLRKRDGQVDPPHEHTYAETWNMNYEKHWHDDSCGHGQKSSLEKHAEATEVLGQVDHEYRVYKATCKCGMVIYKLYELNYSNVEVGEPYIFKIKELVMPTVENDGKVVYYPNTPTKTETLVVPKVGGNRRATWGGEVRYDRAYFVSEEAGHYFAKIHTEAFGYDGDDDNFVLAQMLYVDPAWKFEISHDVYLGSRYVQGNGFVKQKPTLTDPGIFGFRYTDMSDQEFVIPALNSTANWQKQHVNVGDYTDEKDVYTFKEDAAYFNEISDEYLRWEYGFVMLDEDNVSYDVVNPSNLAANTRLESRCDENGAFFDDFMYFGASVSYGSLEIGDYIYFETEFNEQGLPVSTDDPSSIKQGLVEGIFEYEDDIATAVLGGGLTAVSSGEIHADSNMYIIKIGYAGAGASDEELFHDDLDYFVFSGTSAAHLYTMYLFQDHDE